MLKTLREAIFRIRFIFHYITYYYIKNEFIKDDLESFNKGLFSNKHHHSLAFILWKYPEFRNLFYYRYKKHKILVSFLSVIARPDNTFRIGADYLGKSPMFYHSFATILSCKHIGDNFIVRNGTTIGNKNFDKALRPTIGDNVDIGANSIIIGDIKIGNNVIIGAGSVVVKNIPSNCIIAGNPAKIIKYIQDETTLRNE